MPTAMSIVTFFAVLSMATISPAASMDNGQQSPLKQPAATQKKYPKIVLYSVSWCPHCKAAKEYLTQNNIPFINRDVELDDSAMDDLTKKYKSQGVPVIVIGNDEVVLKGFDQQKLEKAVGDVQKKH